MLVVNFSRPRTILFFSKLDFSSFWRCISYLEHAGMSGFFSVCVRKFFCVWVCVCFRLLLIGVCFAYSGSKPKGVARKEKICGRK